MDENKKKEHEERTQKFVDSWRETSRVIFDKEKKEITETDKNVEKIKVPASRKAKCDLCNIVIGRFDEIKHKIEPETFCKAIKKGLLPRGDSWKLTNIFGPEQAKGVIKNWKRMALGSETPWALCEGCNNELEKCLKG